MTSTSNHASGPTRFIVLEGLDGAGTTTQARKLNDYFTQRGTDSFLTFEPTDGAIGTFTRELLTGADTVSHRVLGLLFAADRLAHSHVVRAQLDAGRAVVCDRYLLSSIAYQTLDPDISAEWVAEVNHGCAVPDLTIFVDVPVAECLQRIHARAEDRTIYEREDRLQTILANYRRHAPFYQQHFGRLATVDGTASVEAVHGAIVEVVESGL
jgi:dTMP kinase